MSEHEDEGGWGAVPGEESHESEETLSPDERSGDDEPDPPGFVPPVAPPPDPRQV